MTRSRLPSPSKVTCNGVVWHALVVTVAVLRSTTEHWPHRCERITLLPVPVRLATMSASCLLKSPIVSEHGKPGVWRLFACGMGEPAGAVVDQVRQVRRRSAVQIHDNVELVVTI